jgi:hypothetical protein
MSKCFGIVRNLNWFPWDLCDKREPFSAGCQWHMHWLIILIHVFRHTHTHVLEEIIAHYQLHWEYMFWCQEVVSHLKTSSHTRDIAYQFNTCLACTRPQVQSPVPVNNRKQIQLLSLCCSVRCIKKSVFVQWCMCVIPALRRQRQENCNFEAKLGYIERHRLNKN